MKKVLLIQYFYKPFSSNQSFRYESIISELDVADVQIDILTSKHRGLLDKEKSENGYIYRVNSRFLIKDLETYNDSRKSNKPNKNFKNTVFRFLKTLIYKVVWPDFAALWIMPAIKKGREISKVEQYDLIISGSFPFSSHIVGKYIKRKHKNMKWIVDYLDPFSIINKKENPSNNTSLYKYLNKIVEKKINKEADKIVVLKEAYSTFSEFFPESLNKTIVAPPMLGINKDSFDKVKPHKFPENNINIVYTGSLYKSIRNPESLLNIFQKLFKLNNRIHLHFFGDLKDCYNIVESYRLNNSENISVYGLVSREKVISYIKGADVLINISNSSQVQLPGKVVEYAYSKKKIINFSKYDNSSDYNFFRDVGLTDSVYNIIGEQTNIESLNQFITSYINIEEININEFLPVNIGKLYLN